MDTDFVIGLHNRIEIVFIPFTDNTALRGTTEKLEKR